MRLSATTKRTAGFLYGARRSQGGGGSVTSSAAAARATTGVGEIVITGGEGDAMLDALFCLTDPGDEVILTDPTYAGMLNRVRLVGAVTAARPAPGRKGATGGSTWTRSPPPSGRVHASCS